MTVNKGSVLLPNDKEDLEADNKKFLEDISEVKKADNQVIENVKYFKKALGCRNDVRLIDYMSLGKGTIYFGKNAFSKLDDKYYMFGTAELKNKKIIVIKPDKKGHKLSETKSGAGRVASKNLCEWLVKNGAKQGKYELKKIKGGFIGMPI